MYCEIVKFGYYSGFILLVQPDKFGLNTTCEIGLYKWHCISNLQI